MHMHINICLCACVCVHTYIYVCTCWALMILGITQIRAEAILSPPISTNTKKRPCLQMYVRNAYVLWCVAVCYGVLWCVVVCWGVLRCVAVCCSVLQCVAVCRVYIMRMLVDCGR